MQKTVDDWGFRIEKPMIIAFAIGSIIFAFLVNKFVYCIEGLGGNYGMFFQALMLVPKSIVVAPLGFSFSLPGLLFTLIAFCGVWMGFLWLITQPNNYMRGKEHGSSRFGTEKDSINYRDDENPDNNIILSETERLVLNPKKFNPKYDRNLNVCVIGGSGSGKTRFYVKPNLMQLNSSYVLTDPKGTLVGETGHLFEQNGYKVKIFNTINFDKSMHYNPFAYIHSEKDIIKLVDVLISNTNEEGKNGGDPFWEKSEKLLYSALIGFIYYYGEPHEKNMNTLLKLLDMANASEENENAESALDLMFKQVSEGVYFQKHHHQEPDPETGKMKWVGAWVKNPNREPDPNNFSVLQYRKFKKGAGKTLKSILISCSARLAYFDIQELQELLSYDELELDKIGDEKTILYCIMSDRDKTFSFLTAMMFSQLFDELCLKADDIGYFDEKKGKQVYGKLKIPVQCIMDEFANIGRLPEFEVLISTIRSRRISATVILQSKAQLKGLYEDHAETIVDCCDALVFLGGKSTETNEDIAKMLGKTTIDNQNVTDSKGQSGSHSVANQIVQRDLMDAAEIGRMTRTHCIVIISGEFGFISPKYDVTKHPRYKYIDPGHDGALFQKDFDAIEFIGKMREKREMDQAKERLKVQMKKKAQLARSRQLKQQKTSEELRAKYGKPNAKNKFYRQRTA